MSAMTLLYVAAALGGLWLANRRLAAQRRRQRALLAQLEQHKQRSHAQQAELQQMQRDFEELLHLKDDFLATVSHQLRTPLTSVVEGIELFRDGVGGSMSAEQSTLVRMMDENAKKLVLLINDILDLQMLKSGRRLLQRRPADLAGVLRHVAQAWQRPVESRAVRVSCPVLPEVFMDAEAVRDVVDQLVRNALRHAPERSEVLLEARLQGTVVEVAVQDAGPGMSAQQVAQLFQPFVHIQTPHAPGSEGNGLGLAFCRQTIERHRGSIWAQSGQGQGMRVMFTLPVVTEAFLLEEACRSAKEDSEYEQGAYALLLISPGPSSAADASVLQRLEVLLQRNTHRGDRFTRLSGARELAIVAVTDPAGLDAMQKRLRAVVEQSGLAVEMAAALWPFDGDSAEALLAAARRRLHAAPAAGAPR